MQSLRNFLCSGWMDRLIVDDKETECNPSLVGGKAYNLWILSHEYKLNVPPWFAVTSRLFAQFIQVLNIFITIINTYCDVGKRTQF